MPIGAVEPGVPEPFSIPLAAFRRWVTGGERKVKVKVLSGLIVISVGVGRDGCRWDVLALLWQEFSELPYRPLLQTHNSLQKSIAFTPRAPKAGPTGGEGVALPAGTKSF